jgi:hypothetical protein
LTISLFSLWGLESEREKKKTIFFSMMMRKKKDFFVATARERQHDSAKAANEQHPAVAQSVARSERENEHGGQTKRQKGKKLHFFFSFFLCVCVRVGCVCVCDGDTHAHTPRTPRTRTSDEKKSKLRTIRFFYPSPRATTHINIINPQNHNHRPSLKKSNFECL